LDLAVGPVVLADEILEIGPAGFDPTVLTLAMLLLMTCIPVDRAERPVTAAYMAAEMLIWGTSWSLYRMEAYGL
jgi:hypothetical protein